MPRLTIMPVLAFAFATPAFSQQTNAVDAQTRQKAEALVMQYVDALNKGDGRAYGALYAPNPIDINPFGKYRMTGMQAQEAVEMPHKLGLTLSAKVDDVESLFGGQGVVVTAPYTATFSNNPATPQVRGNMLFLLERAGTDWKIRIQTASRLAPNAPAR